ncbi:MAG: glutamine--tRNA ligase/YqeY domain fusion protein [Planctomycetes bacterium]|nr:glutamine--tRNA ligase/YqeY domain fusion protein [Planctomycetota bacterium]
MSEVPRSSDFIREIVANDLASGKHSTPVTRFPPEPNGYLHIGHAKAICLDFGIAEEFQGRCHLRFDDTNPEKEEEHYARAIEEDVRWLGFQWDGEVHHASDYYEQLCSWAIHLIENGNAYVDEQSAEEIRGNRGSLTEPGVDSPFRNRSVEENLIAFQEMKAGQREEGSCVLRAKIDMASANLNLRDPALYRILKKSHPRTGDDWCIYPMYDFAHGQSDALEGITHSLCTLEFENHRPLYEWFIEHLPVPHQPRQIEFSRLNITRTVLSKRKLARLVEESKVAGWDDPRMPTLSGLRRRGFTPQAIRDFCAKIGITKTESVVDHRLLEHCLRQDLEHSAQRRMAVLNPVKVVLTDFPEGKTEVIEMPNHAGRPELGTREIPFSRELYIEREDFLEDPPEKFFRLAPGKEIKLRYAYVIRCDEVVKDSDGEVVELRCSHDPETRHGLPKDRKVKGILHWVPAEESVDCEVRLYDHLFHADHPEGEGDLMDSLAENSVQTIQARCEPALATATSEERFQFERMGYFVADRYESCSDRPVFNRTVSLKDSWAREQAKS